MFLRKTQNRTVLHLPLIWATLALLTNNAFAGFQASQADIQKFKFQKNSLFLLKDNPIRKQMEWIAKIHQDTPEEKEFQDIFGGAKNILFLSEGTKKDASIANKLRPQFAAMKQHVLKTDISYPEEGNFSPRFVEKHLDNQKKFPLPSDRFDRIIMRNGVCTCPKDQPNDITCGGIPVSHEGFSHFLKEVIRVLNKKNENSWAFLHGPELVLEDNATFPNQKTFDRYQAYLRLNDTAIKSWEESILDLSKEYPDLEIQMIFFSNPPTPSKKINEDTQLNPCIDQQYWTSNLFNIQYLQSFFSNEASSPPKTSSPPVNQKVFQGVMIRIKKLDHESTEGPISHQIQ
jgi:hypothetical protein